MNKRLTIPQPLISMGGLRAEVFMPVRARRYGRAALLAALASWAAAVTPVQAQPAPAPHVLERVARSGALRVVGPADRPPMLSLNAQGQPQGYAALVARRIADLVGQAIGRPVRLVYEPVSDPGLISQRLGEGTAELACGLPFTWAHDEVLDFTNPIGISGLRLLTPVNGLDGNPASLAGRRIGVVQDSLAETQLRGLQPAATVQTFPGLPAALGALTAGQLDGVVGDWVLMAGLVQQQGLQGLALRPDVPYLRYAVACAVPENSSAFRSLANRAIAQLQQGYVVGNPVDVAAVDRWLGPGSALNLSPVQIRGVFDALLLGVEPLRPAPSPSASQSQ